MAKIENIHCTICTQPISSSWQNALPPAFAPLQQRGVSVCQKVTDYLLLRLVCFDPGIWRCVNRRWVFHGEVVDVVDARTKKKPGGWCKLCQGCNMELSKVLTWIWQSSYMNLSKLFSAFLAFAKQNQNEVWLRFQKLVEASAFN